MTSDIQRRLADAIASEMEVKLNTGSRTWSVDRESVFRTLVQVQDWLFANHDPGDEDRSER